LRFRGQKLRFRVSQAQLALAAAERAHCTGGGMFAGMLVLGRRWWTRVYLQTTRRPDGRFVTNPALAYTGDTW